MRIYKSGELGIDKQQSITIISTTNKGLKVELLSCDWDTPNYTLYVEETDHYNRDTDFTAKYNEYYTVGGIYTEGLVQSLQDADYHGFNIYRVIEG